MKNCLIGCLLLLGAIKVWAADDLETWLTGERAIAILKMQQNISPSDGRPGVVIASPQRSSPNYYYNWTRDAAVTMNTVMSLYLDATGADSRHYHDQLVEYAQFSRSTQKAVSNLGEPKFEVSGPPYAGSWCRPQSDGPALRTITLSRFAVQLLKQGEGQTVASLLYDGKQPTDTVIKADLEYVSHNWQEKTCDLWEEVSADHFYTRMVQRRALLDGADLASQLGDQGAADWYRLQAANIQNTISDFWNGSLLVPSLNRVSGLTSKLSGIDSSVILAAIHADRSDGFMTMNDGRLVATFNKQIEVFRQKYAINGKPEMPGVAIGRYPEDIYDGLNFQGGNPWVLLTASFARYCYKSARELLSQGKKNEASQLISRGDDFMRRIRFHANADGSLSEQIERDTGYMTSARDLTWSYVELIEAVNARELVQTQIKRGDLLEHRKSLRRTNGLLKN